MATAAWTRLAAVRTDLTTPAAVAFSTIATAAVAADHGGYWPTSWGWTTLAVSAAALVALVLGAERPGALELTWLGGVLLICAWTAASMAWTTSKTQTTLEVERSLVYAGIAVSTIAIARRGSVAGLLWGSWLGATLICLYALATRLFPDRLAVTDSVAGYRLSTQIGYLNVLGLVAAIAALLAVGLVVETTHTVPRILAGASLPILMPTLYFTFSRGAWLALAAGIAFVIALSPRRLTFVTALGVIAVPSGLAVVLAYHARALRLSNVPLSRAVGAGHSLAWQLLLAAALAAVVSGLWVTFAHRVTVPQSVRLGYATVLAAALVASIVVVVVHYGGPSATWSHARRSLEGNPSGSSDVSKRLLTIGNAARLDQWHVSLDEWRGHRVLGTGAGTYAQYWMAARSDAGKVLDVHNLYLETLAELGLVGLVILVGALLVPLAGAARSRHLPLVAIAAGGYATWLAHAAYDWDWELPAVTLPALICAGSILASGRRGGPITGQRQSLLVLAALAIAVVGTLGLIENRSLAQSADHAQRGEYKQALALARRARRLAPWSSDPWAQIAGIRIQQGRRIDAVDAYKHAVAKDPDDWTLWLGLAAQSRSGERARAVDRLRVLAPSVAKTFTGTP
ncbi:MAG: O-antigen ligase family protein [Gaiellaceae bacterium]